MASKDEIRQSLMRIKSSQVQLLRQLRSQHDALQGYLDSSNNQSINFSEGIPKNVNYMSNNSPNSFLINSPQSSLQLSKSQGNIPNYRQMIYKSTSTGAEDILQNNYKKMEQLLVKQRKLYQENNILQQENQSLNEDYRKIKKMYYQLKQAQKDEIIILNFLLGDVIYNGYKQLLLETPNNEIVQTAKKSWNKFKQQHPKLFEQQKTLYSIVKNKPQNLNTGGSHISSIGSSSNNEAFIEESQKWLKKIFSLLDQDFNLKMSTIKSKDDEIEELREKISQLINLNGQVTKNKQEILLMEQNRLKEIEKENYVLNQKVKQLQKQLINKNSDKLCKSKQLECIIILKQKQNQLCKLAIKQKQQDIEKYKHKLHQLKSQKQSLQSTNQQYKKQLQILRSKVKQKQNIIHNHLQLNQKQNFTIQKITRDMSFLQQQTERTKGYKSQTQHKLRIQYQAIARQLATVKAEYIRSSQIFKKQINSLLTHNKQIKSQLAMLVKSQQNARLSEMRYKQLLSQKKDQIKMSNNVDHLWAVKEIQYTNILSYINGLK